MSDAWSRTLVTLAVLCAADVIQTMVAEVEIGAIVPCTVEPIEAAVAGEGRDGEGGEHR